MGFGSHFDFLLTKCTSPNLLGEVAQYLAKEAPSGSSPIPIEGVPSREALDIFVGESAKSGTRRSTFGVNLARLKASGVNPKENDKLTIRGISFRIKDVEEDGEGGAVLVLTKSP